MIASYFLFLLKHGFYECSNGQGLICAAVMGERACLLYGYTLKYSLVYSIHEQLFHKLVNGAQ